MLPAYAEARNIVFLNGALLGRSCVRKRKEPMSRTIEAIQRHMITPIRSGNRAHSPLGKPGSEAEIDVVKNPERGLIAEWQTGVEILGHAQRKLRLAFISAPSSVLALAGQ
jgi:hypothetical protein